MLSKLEDRTPDTAPEARQTEPCGFALQPSQSYLLRKPRDENKNERKDFSNEYKWVELPKHEQNEKIKYSKGEAPVCVCGGGAGMSAACPREAIRTQAVESHLLPILLSVQLSENVDPLSRQKTQRWMVFQFKSKASPICSFV